MAIPPKVPLISQPYPALSKPFLVVIHPKKRPPAAHWIKTVLACNEMAIFPYIYVKKWIFGGLLDSPIYMSKMLPEYPYIYVKKIFQNSPI